MVGDNTGTDQLSRWHLARITGPVVFFSIILPFIDNVTDLTMIVRLYYGVHYCNQYCPSSYGLKTCEGYRECRENATIFCNGNNTQSNWWYFKSDNNSDAATCAFRRYTFLASTLLCKNLKLILVSCCHKMYPSGFFLLNYMAAFITWYKLEKNKISTFAFPIFNLYPIYGTGCPKKTLFCI